MFMTVMPPLARRIEGIAVASDPKAGDGGRPELARIEIKVQHEPGNPLGDVVTFSATDTYRFIRYELGHDDANRQLTGLEVERDDRLYVEAKAFAKALRDAASFAKKDGKVAIEITPKQVKVYGATKGGDPVTEAEMELTVERHDGSAQFFTALDKLITRYRDTGQIANGTTEGEWAWNPVYLAELAEACGAESPSAKRSESKAKRSTPVRLVRAGSGMVVEATYDRMLAGMMPVRVKS